MEPNRSPEDIGDPLRTVTRLLQFQWSVPHGKDACKGMKCEGLPDV